MRSDPVLDEIADYVCGPAAFGDTAYETARLALVDGLGCAFLGLGVPECARLLGPTVPGTVVPGGVRVPGTSFVLDPVKAAFDLTAALRWLDFNDTWLAAEWGHPSDNIGAIVAAAAHAPPGRESRVSDILTAMIQAYEVQGVLALENAFNRHGLDHVVLVRVASAAVATRMLGGRTDQVRDAISQAFADGGTLRNYRQAPSTGPRKSWAAGDAAARGVWLALMTLAGEPGYPAVLSTPAWGFSDVFAGGRPVTLGRPLGDYVMENVLFKISYPAEFHAQTAAEAAAALHPQVGHRLDDIDRIDLTTQEPAVRIISKTGALHNPADRDHCLEYITATALMRGDVTVEDYGDEAAGDPRIDRLRARMVVREDPRYSADYLDPSKRSIANAVQVHFDDGSSSERVEVEYPLGHRTRRSEGRPLLLAKFERHVRGLFGHDRAEEILATCSDPARFDRMAVRELLELLGR